MIAAVQYDLVDLLERAGARIRVRGRADCPRCKRRRSVSFDEGRAVYHCHGAGCGFSGGCGTLARELGLARPLSRSERQRLHQEWERANRAARALYERVKARRFELLEELRALGRAELGAHAAGTNHPVTWSVFALVYRERPRMLAELAVLENCGAADLIRFLSAGPEVREQVIDAVLMNGGPYDTCVPIAGFVELAL